MRLDDSCVDVRLVDILTRAEGSLAIHSYSHAMGNHVGLSMRGSKMGQLHQFVHDHRQSLAIQSRDEALLGLLSAPTSKSQLATALQSSKAPLAVRKAIEKRGLRNLNKYIKQQVDSLTPAQRAKLEALPEGELKVLKSKIVAAAAYRAMQDHGKMLAKRYQQTLKKRMAFEKAHPFVFKAGQGPHEAQALGKRMAKARSHHLAWPTASDSLKVIIFQNCKASHANHRVSHLPDPFPSHVRVSPIYSHTFARS